MRTNSLYSTELELELESEQSEELLLLQKLWSIATAAVKVRAARIDLLNIVLRVST